MRLLARTQCSCAIQAVLVTGLLGAATAAAQETKTYTYDALGRLVEVKRDKVNSEDEIVSYTFDNAGNRASYVAASEDDGGADGADLPPDPEPDSNSPEKARVPMFNGLFYVTLRPSD